MLFARVAALGWAGGHSRSVNNFSFRPWRPMGGAVCLGPNDLRFCHSFPGAPWVVLEAWLASQEVVRYWRAGPGVDPLLGQCSFLCHEVTRLVESAVAQGNPDLRVFSNRRNPIRGTYSVCSRHTCAMLCNAMIFNAIRRHALQSIV